MSEFIGTGSHDLAENDRVLFSAIMRRPTYHEMIQRLLTLAIAETIEHERNLPPRKNGAEPEWDFLAFVAWDKADYALTSQIDADCRLVLERLNFDSAAREAAVKILKGWCPGAVAKALLPERETLIPIIQDEWGKAP